MSLVHTRMYQFQRFIRFYRKAQTIYDIHSPFMAEYISLSLDDRRQFYAFPTIEAHRGYLLEDDTLLPMHDLGAGSLVSTKKHRTVADLAKATGVPPRVGRWLFKTVDHFKPQFMVELGTSMGISAMYQAAARPSGTLYTLEGNPAVADHAKAQFHRIGLPNIKTITGGFDEQLPKLLDQLARVDYAFLDGNHQKEPTLRYARWLLPKLHKNSILLIADLHWSSEMEEAWKILKSWPEVTASLDVYDFGVLFFSSAFRQKQHWTVVPKAWKPWRLGIKPPVLRLE